MKFCIDAAGRLGQSRNYAEHACVLIADPCPRLSKDEGPADLERNGILANGELSGRLSGFPSKEGLSGSVGKRDEQTLKKRRDEMGNADQKRMEDREKLLIGRSIHWFPWTFFAARQG